MINITGQDPVIKTIIGVQKKESCEYHWSQYVLSKDTDEGCLLYNTLTCELVFLAKKEDQETVDKLINKWFLVPQGFDEFQYARKVKRLRQLIYRNELNKKKNCLIERYWILTTTYCNARCFYCHENGIPKMHMSSQIAEDVIHYIEKHSIQKKIHIMWYGGEPLINKEIIDIITMGLRGKGFVYTSSMISNGYEFDTSIVKKAVGLWNLKEVQITLDGMEKTYNKIKAYLYPGNESPFYKVLRNIELLLESKIQVTIRLNIDNYNAEEMFTLTDMLIDRFLGNKGFSIYSAPLLEECLGTTKKRSDLQRQEVYEAHYRLSKKLNTKRALKKTELAKTLKSELRCKAVSKVRVIFPDGQLAFCHDYTAGILSGNIYGEEPDNEERMEYSKCLPEKKECRECVKYPQCIRLSKCFNNKCNVEMINEWKWTTQNEMVWEYEKCFPQKEV